MDKLKLEAPWEEVKALILEAAPQLRAEDLVYSPGEDDELIMRLATKMNRSNEETKGWIESVSHTTNKAS